MAPSAAGDVTPPASGWQQAKDPATGRMYYWPANDPDNWTWAHPATRHIPFWTDTTSSGAKAPSNSGAASSGDKAPSNSTAASSGDKAPSSAAPKLQLVGKRPTVGGQAITDGGQSGEQLYMPGRYTNYVSKRPERQPPALAKALQAMREVTAASRFPVPSSDAAALSGDRTNPSAADKRPRARTPLRRGLLDGSKRLKTD